MQKESLLFFSFPSARNFYEGKVTKKVAHSDYYGQKGVVIVRRPDSLSFANPGDMRPGLRTALSGGTSDARNATIMKMFGLLDFGERAGSGIPDLFDICNFGIGKKRFFCCI